MASTNRFRGSVNLDGENYIFYFHYLLAKFGLPLIMNIDNYPQYWWFVTIKTTE